jgi:uncharacterized protein (TIGR03437 family)
MYRFSLSFLALVCLLGSAASASNVVVLPQENSGGTTGYIYNPEPFSQLGTFTVDPLAFEVVWHPNGQKFYVLSKSLTNSIAVYSGTSPFAQTTTRPLPNISTAKISPDGRRLYVLSQALRIYDTATDQEVTGINTGGTPIDVDFSIDSSRAYILNNNGTLAAVDVFSSRVVSTLTIPNNPNQMVVGPNGLIYVTAQNRILEIDGRDALTVVGAEIPATGANCLRPQFTPDGSRLVVTCSVLGSSTVYVVDIITRTVSSTSLNNAVADRFKVISNSSALYYIPTSNIVLRGGLVAPLSPPVQLDINGIGPLSGGRFLITSDEIPTNRYFFSNSTNSISRINLESNTLNTALTQPTFVGPMFFTGRAPTGIPFSVIAINPSQQANVNTQGRPLVVRVSDSASRPLSGVTVNFATTANNVQLSAGAAVTNKDGFASINFVAPPTTGTITIAASTSGSQGQSFTINVVNPNSPGGGGGGGGGGTGPAPIQIVSGNGQIVFAQFLAPQPLTVRVRDGSGNPQNNVRVTWTVQSGDGVVTLAETTTDVRGIAQTQYGSTLFYNDGFNGPRVATIRASSPNGSVDFVVTSYPASGNPPLLLPANPPSITLISPAEGSIIRVQAGVTVTNAIRATVINGTLANNGRGLEFIGFNGSTGNDPETGVTADCAQGSLSNGQGEVSCDLVAGSRLGQANFQACVGNCQPPGRAFNFLIEVTPGPAAVIVKRQGDNQSGGPGTITPLALRGAVTDAFNNRLAGQTVRVEIIQGEATIESLFNTTTTDGEFSFLVRFGSTPGEVRVRTSVGNASTIWTLTNNVQVGNFAKVSGDNQTAVIGRQFAQPLVVQLFDAQSRPINGATVSFAVTNGSATVSNASATTNTQGSAQVNITAGQNPGPVSVTATAVGRSVSFNLTVLPPGPTITRVTNAASFAAGVTPCGLVTIFGSNIAPTLNGVVQGNSFVGPYALRLNNVTVEIGGRMSPIVSIANLSGQEQATVQAPCDLNPGPTTLRMTVNEGSSTFNTTVLPVQPGVFETLDSANRRVGVVVKSDGTYMTLENPAVRGERGLIGFFTGLGQTVTPTTTNSPGLFLNSPQVAAQIIIGVNNEGVPVTSATMAPGLVGIYIVQFDIPAEFTPGSYRPYGIGAIGPDGVYQGGNASTIHVR